MAARWCGWFVLLLCVIPLIMASRSPRHSSSHRSRYQKKMLGPSTGIISPAMDSEMAEACRGFMVVNDAMERTITSPGYPGEYPNNLMCRWLLQAPVGNTIDLAFNGPINIEPSNTGTPCAYDVLKIFDGHNSFGNQLLQVCDLYQYSNLLSTTGSRAYVYFKTDESVTYSGFSLNYTIMGGNHQENQCLGTEELTASSGTVTSPGFPNNYGIYSECGFRITAPEGQIIEIEFLSLRVEYEPSCMYDSVMVYDGSTESGTSLGVYCGEPSPLPVLTSTSNAILVKFMSDLSINDQGFRFSWKFLTDPSTKPNPACGDDQPQLLERSNGEFSSPGYANNMDYGNNHECSWRIMVPMDMRAHLRFADFALEDSSLCRFDRLTVYDGYDNTAISMGPYCGSDTPGAITGSGNVLYVTFRSDASLAARGFRIEFSGKERMDPDGGGEMMCGMPSIDPKFGRIVGGQEATPHGWPWQISMRFENYPFSGGWGHWCGGSVIHQEWVLTAAHCVEDYPVSSAYRVVAGAHRISSDVSESSAVTVNVREIIMHEDYNPVTFDNDIALFRLDTPLTYNSEVSPVCMPSMDLPDRTLCVTTGWGNTLGTGDSDVLQQVQLPKVSREECNQDGWYSGQITRQMICAGYPEGQKDSCQGDSGGPLVASMGGAWTQYGITSWGEGCALARRPGVYTRLARFVSWVEEKTGVEF